MGEGSGVPKPGCCNYEHKRLVVISSSKRKGKKKHKTKIEVACSLAMSTSNCSGSDRTKHVARH